MMESWFDLNGARLQVLAEDSALLEPLLPYLHELRAEAAQDAAFVLSIARQADLAPPAGAEPVFDGLLPEGVRGQQLMEGDGTRWVLVPGDIALRIAPNRAAAHIAVRPGCEKRIGGTVGILAIDTALRWAGQHLLHAAALQLPGTRDAFVLLAPSGAGKTTTSLALAHDGFGLLADDASIVMPRSAGSDGGRPRVWGLPRALKVHRRTAGMLPRVGALLSDRWNSDGEQVLTRQALRGVVDAPPPRTCTLIAAVVLGPRVGGCHEMRTVRRSELLAHLAADNIFKSSRGVLSDDLKRFESISRIVADVGAYELRVGSELATLAQSVVSALR
jgi:hypothetical protein